MGFVGLRSEAGDEDRRGRSGWFGRHGCAHWEGHGCGGEPSGALEGGDFEVVVSVGVFLTNGRSKVLQKNPKTKL